MNKLYEELLKSKSNLGPLRTAVINPVDQNSLGSVIATMRANLLDPVLIGPKDEIEKAAHQFNYDIKNIEIIDIKEPSDMVRRALDLVHSGIVYAIMKGHISTQELMRPIVRITSGLHGKRRMSHVFAFWTPKYHKPLFLTDAAINIAPSLMDKKDIIENAIELFRMAMPGVPKVAILSATEKVNEKMESTIDAALLSKMADRGQIVGGVVDGPLAFDNAISMDSAKIKGIKSTVAGDSDILVVPNIESGNIAYKQLHTLFGVDAGGIVVGTKVPIILNSRSTPIGLSQKISAALALLYMNQNQETEEEAV